MKCSFLAPLLFITLFLVSVTSADVPRYINYQGRLTDDLGNPLNGDYWMTFSIWDDPESGEMKWHSNPRATIHVENGLFTHELGSSYPLPDDIFTTTDNWLEITVQSETIEPRTRLITAPYAYHALEADDDGDWSESDGNLYRADGLVGIGMSTPRAKLDVSGVMRILRDDDFSYPGEGEGMELYYDPVNRVGIIQVFERPLGYRKLNFANGSVGIGVMNAEERLDVSGKVQAQDFITTSDLRFKTGIERLENVLDKLDGINGVSFEWNEAFESLGREAGGRGIGVIAQEVEKAFPELVTTQEESGYKSVSYNQLTAVLLEAIKELKGRNEELKRRIEVLEQRAKQ